MRAYVRACVRARVLVREREGEKGTEREGGERQDKTNSLFPRVVNKHTSAFFHSALAQRGTNY